MTCALSAFESAGVIGREGERYYRVSRPAAGTTPATFTPLRVALLTALWVLALVTPLLVGLFAR